MARQDETVTGHLERRKRWACSSRSYDVKPLTPDFLAWEQERRLVDVWKLLPFMKLVIEDEKSEAPKEQPK
jgi:hypothetical protein